MKGKILGLLLAFCMVFLVFTTANATSSTAAPENTKQDLKVHFIDVEKGDCILVCTPDNKTMLIDGGDIGYGEIVVPYIKSLGINKIDKLVLTHPDDDHLAGLIPVIYNFEIGDFNWAQMEYDSDCVTQLQTALKAKKIPVNNIKPGMKINLSNKVNIDVFGPIRLDYENANNASIVMKLTYGTKSFLFEGDAEDLSEADMMQKGYDFKADLLKVGHHGKNDATTPAFLKKVSPEYAVIQTGVDYNYQETLMNLTNAGIKTYVNVNFGTIISSCDGKKITMSRYIEEED